MELLDLSNTGSWFDLIKDFCLQIKPNLCYHLKFSFLSRLETRIKECK